MKDKVNSILVNEFEDLAPSRQQEMAMGTALVVLNLFLMISIGLYWTNPAIHLYLSGQPL